VKTFSKAQNRVVRDKLIRARRPCGLTEARAVVSQQQIAKLAHISQALLSNFENAKTDLDADTLRAVEDAIMEIGRHRASEGFRILSDAVEQGDGPKSSSAL
jgi:transcriptional regulator with XRE-family HTH domain